MTSGVTGHVRHTNANNASPFMEKILDVLLMLRLWGRRWSREALDASAPLEVETVAVVLSHFLQLSE